MIKISSRDVFAGVADPEGWEPLPNEQRAWVDSDGKFLEMPWGMEHHDYPSMPGDYVHDGIEAGWSRIYFDGNLLSIDLGKGKSPEWVMSRLKTEWTLPKKELGIENETVPIDEGEDAEKAWKNRNDRNKKI